MAPCGCQESKTSGCGQMDFESVTYEALPIQLEALPIVKALPHILDSIISIPTHDSRQHYGIWKKHLKHKCQSGMIKMLSNYSFYFTNNNAMY